jgi:hypothetical protein
MNYLVSPADICNSFEKWTWLLGDQPVEMIYTHCINEELQQQGTETSSLKTSILTWVIQCLRFMKGEVNHWY